MVASGERFINLDFHSQRGVRQALKANRHCLLVGDPVPLGGWRPGGGPGQGAQWTRHLLVCRSQQWWHFPPAGSASQWSHRSPGRTPLNERSVAGCSSRLGRCLAMPPLT